MHKVPRKSLRQALAPVVLPALVALVALAGLMALPAHAQWKWRDKEGHITVSDRPPPRDVADADILGRPDARHLPAPQAPASAASAALVPAARVTSLEREVDAARAKAEQERVAKAKAEDERVAAQRAENCRRARSQEMALQTGQRMARINANGEREVLDDKGRAEEMHAAREVIASDCR